MVEVEDKLIKEDGLGLLTATFFLAGTMAGSGVLALPMAMVGTGPAELAMLVFFAATSAFVGIKLGQCWVILEERYPEYRGQVRDPYPSIAEKAAGKIGRFAAITCINLCLYGAGCVFIVLIASFIKNIFDEYNLELNFGIWMVIVAAVMIPPCWLGTPNDFWPLAIGALITTVVACVLVMVRLPMDVVDPDHCLKEIPDLNTTLIGEHSTPNFLGIARAFSTTMFAFAGAPNFPTIQSDMKDRRQFSICVSIAMGVLLCIYAPMAAVGYFELGDAVKGNIVDSMCNGNVKIAVECLLLAHLISAFPIVVNPPNQFIEGVLGIPKNFTWKRVVFRSFVIVGLLFIAESLPDFGSILDLVGGSTVTLLTFVFPPFFYMRLVDMSNQSSDWEQRKASIDDCSPLLNHKITISLKERLFCWFVITVGIVGGVCSTGVAVYSIADSNFKMPCYIETCR
ncbi:amino acid transporter ANT1 isoform X2 [Eurytemora carolleeae]|nr:amino acid transporter ANT1 isoform X2 [Eurytemora carolleeae]XP_023328376.1 amino acid transporter ANT1 isoform X2 [Eurytemora carolleeae]XP_023328377.1 amino acid transporter ANT1 isoform X2 [Eurytemora carolleeae]|eukprot:XP_023328375.1 amino acid transporter ANT1-like isoform X2 [Eurytemora affinis]